jgi:XTP/dITP diphosphohydrolase
VLATRNPGKAQEIRAICVGWPVEWVDPQRSWPRVEETGETYLENARLKAHAAARATGLASLAEDSGIEVSGLGERPGPRSARYSGERASERDNLHSLIQQLAGLPSDDRTGRYRCVAVVAWPTGGELWAEGTCPGHLVLEPRGTSGFGYDPIFVPAGESRTMAELTPVEKNGISHRGRALRALAARLCEST